MVLYFRELKKAELFISIFHPLKKPLNRWLILQWSWSGHNIAKPAGVFIIQLKYPDWKNINLSQIWN